MKYLSAKKGVTLVELLLVIILFSLMTLFGINYYRQHIQYNRVQKTAEQIQAILQAGGSYYLQNNASWPKAGPPVDKDFAAYLPVGSLDITLATAVKYQGVDGQATDGSDGKRFQVQLDGVPRTTALRLLSLLPNATGNNACYDSSKSLCTIYAEIAIPPLFDVTPSNYLIKTVGETSGWISNDASRYPVASADAIQFDCPKGWGGTLSIFLQSMRAKQSTDSELTCFPGVSTRQLAKICTSNDPDCFFNKPVMRPCLYNLMDHTYHCSFQIAANYRRRLGSQCDEKSYSVQGYFGEVRFAYVGYCCKMDGNGNCLASL